MTWKKTNISPIHEKSPEQTFGNVCPVSSDRIDGHIFEYFTIANFYFY